MGKARTIWQIADVVSTAAVTVAAVAILWFVWRSPSSKTSGTAGSRPSAIEAVEGITTTGESATNGQPGAAFALIEFSDFQCPFCGRYARDTYKQIQRDFVETGKVVYVFRHFPLEAIHPLAFNAAEAAECAKEQHKFWDMHDRLFANQNALAPPELRAHARSIGIRNKQFAACMANDGAVDAIGKDEAEGARLGVKSTPTFFIGRVQSENKIVILSKLTGALPFHAFHDELERVMAMSPDQLVGALR